MSSEFKNQFCYVSTPEHQSTFYGKYIYIYTDKGQLSLTDDGLKFVGSKSNYSINYNEIKNIEMSNYSRIAKPFKLNFIKIVYTIDSIEHTVLLTPTSSGFTPVNKTNQLVNDCLSKLLEINRKIQNT
ncbi:hypothetical protein [Shewanella dokdonensis]|uniref:HTH LytTR-type domain-containing protein n=1 Tax=Shewanella dokdonensis TaxID=712036 RepID=A0ABX8DCL0_9GAMM|nr:hypothetical protein [Shewanella dokdonensis]MCL1074470.1 hypothetical protein [Shewanella dokdonensis]QVK22493.1 hypothetical protein KHX94_14200 [Shewanella dokdonensis]